MISVHAILNLIYNKQQEKEKKPLSLRGGHRILPTGIGWEGNDAGHINVILRDATNRVGRLPP